MKRIDQAFKHIDSELPASLPMVDELVKQYADQQPFKGVTALLFQHQLSNHYVQIGAMIRLGLAPERIIWVDIPYTSNDTVRRAVIDDFGIPEQNLLKYDYSVLEPYTLLQRTRTNQVIRSLLNHPPDRLLVLDDGAYFIESLMYFDQPFDRVAVVEQTTRGVIKLNDSVALQYEANQLPIINVAESESKKTLESPFIGKSVVQCLSNKLRALQYRLEGKRVLMLGYGSVGKQVARFFVKDFNVSRTQIHVYDPRETDSIVRDGFALWDRRKFDERYDAIIGSSGQESFSISDFVFANDGALLISCSSGDVEFSKRDFVEMAELHEDDDVFIVREAFDEFDIHADIPIRFPGRTITLINATWPINFDGHVNCIPVEYMQPTICMMVRAAIQAVDAMDREQTGLIPLDPAFVDQIGRRFKQYLGEDASIYPDAESPR
ncbi:MAG: hypothetical protein AAGH65_00405 [Pseudomonadota bacterium]